MTGGDGNILEKGKKQALGIFQKVVSRKIEAKLEIKRGQ